MASVASGVLSLAAALTAKKPSAADATGSQSSFAADPDANIPLIIGRTGTAGNIVARFGFDTKDAGDNDRQSFISVLSLGPVKEVEPTLGVDRSPVSFDAAGRAIGTFRDFMWRTTQVGLLSSAALAFGTGAGAAPGWTAQHKLSGKAATAWTLRFDTKAKLFQNGVPAPMNVVKGQFCYDPRKDSTYPGGSGPHRMADPADRAAYDAAVATWEYSECPYLNGLRYVHGYWQRDMANPSSDWQRVMGMGAPLAGIDLASFVEGANVSDANGWKVGGVIYSGDDKWASLKKILQAGMGEPLALGAKVSCLVSAPKVSLATITVDDVVGEGSVCATQPRRDRINTITPRFRLEVNNWQLLPGAPITVEKYVTDDRGKRSKPQDYPFIQDSSQVGTAVRYDIENAREFGPIVLPCKLFWMGYKPGDCVTAELPELGLVAQPILLLNRGLNPSSGTVTLTARSETPGKHAFALGQTATPPPTPGVTGAPIAPVPGVNAWAITGTSVTANGVTMPALIVIGAVDAGTAQTVTFEYRRFVSGQGIDDGWVAAGIEAPDVTTKIITGIASATDYEVSIRYTVRGTQSGRRILGPVTSAAYEGIRGADGRDGLNGSNGAPGATGPDGRANYLHTAYANAPDGSVDFTTGAPGSRKYLGVLVDFIAADSNTPTDYTWSLIKGVDGLNGANGTPGANGADGRPSYVHIAYSNAADGSVDFSVDNPVGRAYVGFYTDQIEADSTDRTKYAWSLVKGADGRDGVNGANGAPGRDGINGGSAYFHVAYANSADGTVDFTTGAPGARTYLGVVVDQNPTDPENSAVYAWSLIKGRDGLNGNDGTPGARGADGRQSYVHFAYSNSPDGSASFSTDDPAGRAYIGVYSDYTVADSGDYRAYTWSLAKGADGGQGPQGPGGPGGPAGPGGAAGTDGFIVQTETPFFGIPSFPSGASKPSWNGGAGTIRLIKGGARITAGVIYGVHSAVNIAGLAHDGSQTFTFSGLTADTGSFYIRATYNGQLYDLRIDVKKVYDGSPAFRGSVAVGGSRATQFSASGQTPVPGGATVRVSVNFNYEAPDPKGRIANFRGRANLYYRNVTDGGGLTLLGAIDGSVATTENIGTSSEPEYQRTPGSVSAAFTFPAAGADKLYEYSTIITNSAGDTSVVVFGSGDLRLEVIG